MSILVTGGAGFIGSHLIERLLSEGHTVVCVDNLNPYYDVTLKRARLARFKDRVQMYETDITDRDALEDVFKEHAFDVVYHLAAQAGVRYSLENPYVYADSNYVGTLNIFELAHRHGSPRIVFASTSSVYGDNKPPFREDMRVDTPLSIYAASKQAGELLARTYNHVHGMDITCARFFTVYGPYGRPDMALFLFTKAMLADEPIKVFNNGAMARDFTYVDDITCGLVRMMQTPKGFEIMNLGYGNPTNLEHFISILEDILGKKAQKEYMPIQMGDVPATHADITKAKKRVGYAPQTGPEEGVRRFIEWYREYYRS